MAFELGDVVPLSVEVRDSAGALANAGAITLTVTLPDGTTATPTVSNLSTGVYTADYASTQAGRHVARWVATGANASAYTDTFSVDAVDPGALMSLAEAKSQLNITTTTHDDELRLFIRATTRICERHVGDIVRRTRTETYDGGVTALHLRHHPVISITSVTESGTAVAADGYELREVSGLLRRVSGTIATCWTYGTGNISVVYVSGRTAVSPEHRLAAAIILQHLWQTQRQGNNLPALGGDDAGMPVGLGWAVPRRAQELLGTPAPLVY